MYIETIINIPYSAEYTRRREHQKNPEGRLYSGLITSKSERCRAASGIPELAVSFLMRANQAVMRTQLTEIKWLLAVLDL